MCGMEQRSLGQSLPSLSLTSKLYHPLVQGALPGSRFHLALESKAVASMWRPLGVQAKGSCGPVGSLTFHLQLEDWLGPRCGRTQRQWQREGSLAQCLQARGPSSHQDLLALSTWWQALLSQGPLCSPHPLLLLASGLAPLSPCVLTGKSLTRHCLPASPGVTTQPTELAPELLLMAACSAWT